ncbi:hypothetical protein HY486_00965 [Candidatus Woesearchaeota archaeon]|nr:hypothetical protein [Candidatus Woesearchaeota archaeon]
MNTKLFIGLLLVVTVFSAVLVFAEGKRVIRNPPVSVGELFYREAKWSCHNGNEGNAGGPTSCKPSFVWKKIADDACKPAQNSQPKCGVNSFKVAEPCSISRKEKGFRFVKFSCHDGSEFSEGSGSSCKSSRIWKEFADMTCKPKCKKQGVNSFAVSVPCKPGRNGQPKESIENNAVVEADAVTGAVAKEFVTNCGKNKRCPKGMFCVRGACNKRAVIKSAI